MVFEVFDEIINMKYFDFFKCVDIYVFGFVYWEIV